MKMKYFMVLILAVISSVMLLTTERFSRVTSGQLISATVVKSRHYDSLVDSGYIMFGLSFEVEGKKYVSGGIYAPYARQTKSRSWTVEDKERADAWFRSHPIGSKWQVTYHTIWPWLNHSELEPLETWSGNARWALFVICGVVLLVILALTLLMSRLIGIAKRYQSR